MGSAGGEEVMRGPSGRGERVVVSVRLRPLNEKEISRNDALDWECINDTTIIFKNHLPIPERSMYPSAYTFDRVFRSDSTTREVYEAGAKEVALSVVSGINSSIFAYGQTSSGKTFTMSGITEYTMADIYDHIERHKEREFLLKFSAMEIYNESVRDLLSSDTAPLRLLDDPERGTIVEKLTEETLRDWNHLIELLSLCEAQRQIGETALNETSSRSHQILRLTVESSAREFLGNDNSSVLTSTVNFVDLAGSERASQSLSAGTRLKEGCHINRSLLTLGTVIRKLSKGRSGHIPYRDSKLTRILQSSLGGNAKTAIICTMSPARSHVEQSRNTLLFASCAKEVTTNAQVNVVMSDKALVKHLQRELARLENSLRSPEPTSICLDTATLLRDKDLQIEKLEKELRELTLQRDLAQSQVEDLLGVVGDDRLPMIWADMDDHYPKLRVRRSWESENPTSETFALADDQTPASGLRTFALADDQTPDVGLRTCDTSQYSDGNSVDDSDDHYPPLPESEDNFLHNGTSALVSVNTPNHVAIDLSSQWDKIEEQSNANSEDLCKEVRCIEIEHSIMKRDIESNTLSPVRDTDALELKVVGNGDGANQEFTSPLLKEDKELNCNQRTVVIPSPQEFSPWLLEKENSSCRSLKLTRSRSCKASFMYCSSSPWFEKEEKDKYTPSNVFEKDFIGRPEGFQKKLASLNYDTEIDKLSRKGGQTFRGSSSVDQLKEQVVTTSTDEDVTSLNTYVAGLKEMAKFQYEERLADDQESEPEANKSVKNVKDVGLDPIQDDLASPSRWPFEFKRLQKEIIELWHSCNVSLVHRTYFFLLFQGDPADSIYMEVELRRLSFLKDTFSRGNQTVVDGQALTPASSVRALRREREMLCKQMQKKLSEDERMSLFLKWGVQLNAKNRRLQLAYRLWTDTEDMNHISESANIVARLTRFVQPEEAFKEMFGLNFTPRRMSRRSHSWKLNIKPFL
ncbi:hypothetical protein AAG906_015670 [Vitis piasezkii]